MHTCTGHTRRWASYDLASSARKFLFFRCSFYFIAVLTVCLDDRRYSVDKGHRNIQNKEHGARNVLGGRVWQALVARVNTPVAWDLARFGIFHGLFGSWEGQNRMPLHNGTRAGTERIGGHLMLYLATSLQKCMVQYQDEWARIGERGCNVLSSH